MDTLRCSHLAVKYFPMSRVRCGKVSRHTQIFGFRQLGDARNVKCLDLTLLPCLPCFPAP
jgi:hypothetical protein